jgi:hypothetical protein
MLSFLGVVASNKSQLEWKETSLPSNCRLIDMSDGSHIANVKEDRETAEPYLWFFTKKPRNGYEVQSKKYLTKGHAMIAAEKYYGAR